jgi:hypothetical protein
MVLVTCGLCLAGACIFLILRAVGAHLVTLHFHPDCRAARKSHAERNPELVALVRRMRRANRRADNRSSATRSLLKAISMRTIARMLRRHQVDARPMTSRDLQAFQLRGSTSSIRPSPP